MNMLTDTDTDTDLTFYSYILLLYYVVSMQHAVTSHKSQVTIPDKILLILILILIETSVAFLY